MMNKKLEGAQEPETESTALASALYEQLRNCKGFGMRDQIQQAAASIASSIAEGFDPRTQQAFIQFLSSTYSPRIAEPDSIPTEIETQPG